MCQAMFVLRPRKQVDVKHFLREIRHKSNVSKHLKGHSGPPVSDVFADGSFLAARQWRFCWRATCSCLRQPSAFWGGFHRFEATSSYLRPPCPLRAERRRREARRKTFSTPGLVTTLRSLLGPPAEDRPGPSLSKSFQIFPTPSLGVGWRT